VATKVAERLAADGAAVDRLALVGLAASRFPATQVPAHTLVLHGEHDDVVPLAAVLDWARPQGLPVTVLPGVGHFFHGQLALLKRLLVQALSS
jgi:alpha/beta superfamily hydrolase